MAAHNAQWLHVEFTDGSISQFLASWLRDNVGTGRHRPNGRRTFDIRDLPASTAARGDPATGPKLWGSEFQTTLTFEHYRSLVDDPTH